MSDPTDGDATATEASRRRPFRWYLSHLGTLARLIATEVRSDNLVQQSAALAFVTTFSLIPLLATFSVIGSQVFRNQPQRILEVLARLFPYSEETIFLKLQEFVEQAREFSGAGFVLFILTALAAFSNVEEALNRIWKVPKRRSFRHRLLSFTILVFWGPLLIGATYSALFYLKQRPGFDTALLARPLQLLPFIVTVVGLSMLYWVVPYTKVGFRHALAGGVLAAILLEGVSEGFALYVGLYHGFSSVYGSFGLALLFLVSIQLGWGTVLLGSEIAYCLQSYDRLVRPRRRAAPLDGAWLGLVALAVVTDRFRRGQALSSEELLAERLDLDGDDLPELLEPLVAAGLLRRSDEEGNAYLLACDPYRTTVDTVLEAYELLHREGLERLDDSLGAPLADLRTRLTEAQRQTASTTSLADLAAAAEPAGPRLGA